MIKGNGKGIQIGDINFTLQIYRSGNNYKLEGIDLLRSCTYNGFVTTKELVSLIDTHNKSIIVKNSVQLNSLRINIWQYDRVVNLIINNLGI